MLSTSGTFDSRRSYQSSVRLRLSGSDSLLQAESHAAVFRGAHHVFPNGHDRWESTDRRAQRRLQDAAVVQDQFYGHERTADF